jgi:hypothetical protein
MPTGARPIPNWFRRYFPNIALAGDIQDYSKQTVIAALTDSSGGAAADGTIGAVTAPTALTDNGGGTADNTVASMAATTALTVTDGAGTNDGTIGAITADASVIAAVQEIAAKIATLITWQTTVQNNFKEITTAQAANRTAIIALTDALTELATKVNEMIAEQKSAGQMASS